MRGTTGRGVWGVALVAAGLLAWVGGAPEAEAFDDGFYISIGLGGAVVSGDRGVGLDLNNGCSAQTNQRFLWYEDVAPKQCVYAGTQAGFEEVSRTDAGSGMSFQLRFGYTFIGLLSPELVLAGHGDPSTTDGSASALFRLRYHPAQHAIDHEDRAWDVSVYAGVGYIIHGFNPDKSVQNGDDAKAWEGVNITFGAGFDYKLAPFVSLGIDLQFWLPQYSSYIANFEKGWRSDPTETPSTFAFLPQLHVTFHP